MHVHRDYLLALILVESRIASRDTVKKLLKKQKEIAAQRGSSPPLGQLLTQEKVVSPRQFLALREIVARCECRCFGCHQVFSVLPAKRAGRRRCLHCGTMTPTPVMDLNSFDIKRSDRTTLAQVSSAPSEQAKAVDAYRARVDDHGCPIPDCIGPYTIVDYIATGGMGVIYRVSDPNGGVDLALKVLRKGSTGELIERFKREGEAEARLKHPAIVEVYDLGEDAGTRYFTMELVDGEPFDQYLARESRYEDILPLLAQICRGLDYAHDNGLIHRDMKPQNILITRDGRAKLTDFGLARDLGLSSLSNDGDIIGTPLYMAPEQINSQIGTIDRRTDVFALGVILFQILTGKLPFPAKSLSDLQQKLLKEATPTPSSFNPKAPPELEGICLKALEKQPSSRYQTARDLAVDLEKWLNGESIPIFKPTKSLLSVSVANDLKSDLTSIPAKVIIGLVISILLALVSGLVVLTVKNTGDSDETIRAQSFVTRQAEIDQRCRSLVVEVKRFWERAQEAENSQLTEAISNLESALKQLDNLKDELKKKEGDAVKLVDDCQHLDQLVRLKLAQLLAQQNKAETLARASKLLSPLLKQPRFPLASQLRFARLLLKEGNSKRALKLFQFVYDSRALTNSSYQNGSESLTASSKEVLQALYGRGRAFLQLGLPRFALKDFEEIEELFESSGPSPFLSAYSVSLQLANTRLALSEKQSAVKTLRRVVNDSRGDSWPERPEALETLARLELESEQLEQATKTIKELGNSATNASVYYRLNGLLAMKQGRFQRALESFHKVIENVLKPTANDYGQRAKARLQLKFFDMNLAVISNAIQDLNMAVSLNAAKPEWRLMRARLFYLFGDAKNARRDIALIGNQSSIAPALNFEKELLEIRIARASTSWDNALHVIEEKLAQFEKQTIKNLYLQQNLLAEHLEMKLMGTLDPEDIPSFPSFPESLKSPRLLRISGTIYELTGQKEKARRSVQEALKIFPGDKLSSALLLKLGGPKRATDSRRELALPELKGIFADHWDPIRDALYFKDQARKLRLERDDERARQFESWARKLLGPKDHALLSRE
jgi:predicted negative regulator of RcsB-dependent stress response